MEKERSEDFKGERKGERREKVDEEMVLCRQIKVV